MKTKGRFITIVATLGLLLVGMIPVRMGPQRMVPTRSSLDVDVRKRQWPNLSENIRRFLTEDMVPYDFEWVARLTPYHYKLFICGLQDAFKDASLHNDWDSVRAFVEAWEMAARVDSDEDLQKSLSKERDLSEYKKMPHPSEYRKQKESTGKG